MQTLILKLENSQKTHYKSHTNYKKINSKIEKKKKELNQVRN